MFPSQQRKVLLAILALAMASIFAPGLPQRALAGEIRQARSFLDYANATQADIESAAYVVDKDTGLVNDKEPFHLVFGSPAPSDDAELWDSIEKGGDFLVTNEDADAFYVSSTFGCKRLTVAATLTSLHGAETGVTYQGETILQFATEQATEAAYRELVKTYGEDAVVADFVVWATAARGWGTEAMGMDVQTSSLTRYINAGTVPAGKVVVAVTDTGINAQHEVFAHTSISSASTSIGNTDDSYEDDDGHGTAVAGIIAESCPTNVEIMAVKVMHSAGSGSSTDCINGIRYAVESGADVINCSWGGVGSEDKASYRAYANRLNECLKEASDQGVLVCTSAGNDGQDMDEDAYTYQETVISAEKTIAKPCWLPSESPYVITVGSLDRQGITGAGQLSSFSNYGDAIDFTAPGGSVRVASHLLNRVYTTDSGTSLACPYVAAACALIKEYDRGIGHEEAVQALAALSRDYGSPGWDRRFGHGMPVFSADEPLGHAWDTEHISWEWTGDDASGYRSATATVPCRVDPTHTTSCVATVTSAQQGRKVIYTATIELEGVSFTDTKTVANGPVGQAEVRVALALGESIDLVFYVDKLTDDAGYYTVTHSFAGGDEVTVNLADKQPIDGAYRFVVARCAAKQMTDMASFSVSYDGEKISSTSYCVRDYCESQIKSNEASTALKELCYAVLDYGASAQTFFGSYHDDAMANETYSSMPAVEALTVPDSWPTTVAGDTEATGVSGLTVTLNTVSQTELLFYFIPDGPLDTYSFSARDVSNPHNDGIECTASEVDGRVRVAVTGIAARYLGDTYQLDIEREGSSCSVSYSPMAYAHAQQNAADGLGTLAKALYQYMLKAQAYWAS